MLKTVNKVCVLLSFLVAGFSPAALAGSNSLVISMD